MNVSRNINDGPDPTTPSHRTQTCDGDLIVEKDLLVGGKLRAASVEQPLCGLFDSYEALVKAYPYPTVGMWAAVGDNPPAPIYRCDKDGVWSPTGEIGVPGLEIFRISKIVEFLPEVPALEDTQKIHIIPDNEDAAWYRAYLYASGRWVELGTGFRPASETEIMDVIDKIN